MFIGVLSMLNDLVIQSLNFLEDQLIDPRNTLDNFYFKDGTKVILDHRIEKIAASASSYVITTDADTNVKTTLIFDNDLSGSLSATFDSDPVTYSINPIQARSGQINTITVTNAAAEAYYLSIVRILVQSST
jgi:hypothetical protein